MAGSALVDRYLPVFQFSETHECTVAAGPARTIEAAAAYQPLNDPFFRAMIGLREAPARLVSLVTGQDRPTSEPFGLHEFTLLEQREDALVFGLIGQFWKLDYGLRPVADGDGFIAFDDGDAAKLVLRFSASRHDNGTTRLVTETRVFCPNLKTRLKFWPYWLVIRPVSGMIRRRILASIKRLSETAAGSKPV